MSTLTTLGILDIIYWPFGMLMKGIYSLVGNYGIAIIIFGIIVKLILLPFAFSNEKTRLRNMRIQPKMREIQQRYKGDTRNPKYQEEMQKLYSEENYNPMKGCLPQLIQFPIIFAVFNAIRRPMLYIYGFSSTTIMVIAQKLFEIDESVRNVFGNAIEKITETTAGKHEFRLRISRVRGGYFQIHRNQFPRNGSFRNSDMGLELDYNNSHSFRIDIASDQHYFHEAQP